MRRVSVQLSSRLSRERCGRHTRWSWTAADRRLTGRLPPTGRELFPFSPAGHFARSIGRVDTAGRRRTRRGACLWIGNTKGRTCLWIGDTEGRVPLDRGYRGMRASGPGRRCGVCSWTTGMEGQVTGPLGWRGGCLWTARMEGRVSLDR